MRGACGERTSPWTRRRVPGQLMLPSFTDGVERRSPILVSRRRPGCPSPRSIPDRDGIQQGGPLSGDARRRPIPTLFAERDHLVFAAVARQTLPPWVESAARACSLPHTRLPAAVAVLLVLARARGVRRTRRRSPPPSSRPASPTGRSSTSSTDRVLTGPRCLLGDGSGTARIHRRSRRAMPRPRGR